MWLFTFRYSRKTANHWNSKNKKIKPWILCCIQTWNVKDTVLSMYCVLRVQTTIQTNQASCMETVRLFHSIQRINEVGFNHQKLISQNRMNGHTLSCVFALCLSHTNTNINAIRKVNVCHSHTKYSVTAESVNETTIKWWTRIERERNNKLV